MVQRLFRHYLGPQGDFLDWDSRIFNLRGLPLVLYQYSKCMVPNRHRSFPRPVRESTLDRWSLHLLFSVQWIISSFTNDPEELARLAGLVKGVLAGGLPQLHVLAYNFTVQAVGLVLMAAVTWKCVTPNNDLKEENVIRPKTMQTE